MQPARREPRYDSPLLVGRRGGAALQPAGSPWTTKRVAPGRDSPCLTPRPGTAPGPSHDSPCFTQRRGPGPGPGHDSPWLVKRVAGLQRVDQLNTASPRSERGFLLRREQNLFSSPAR